MLSTPPRPRSCIAIRAFSAAESIWPKPSTNLKKTSSGLAPRRSSTEIPTFSNAATASSLPSSASAVLRFRNFIASDSPSTDEPASLATSPTVLRNPTLTPAFSAASPMLSNSLPISFTTSRSASPTRVPVSSIAFRAESSGAASDGPPATAAETAPAIPPVNPEVSRMRLPTMAPATKGTRIHPIKTAAGWCRSVRPPAGCEPRPCR
jgi:hypothetical protein